MPFSENLLPIPRDFRLDRKSVDRVAPTIACAVRVTLLAALFTYLALGFLLAITSASGVCCGYSGQSLQLLTTSA